MELGKERTRLADRLRFIIDASDELAATTDDYARLLDVVARRIGEVVGDLCTIRLISDDRAWLEATGGIYHRDPALVATTREVMASRQRVDEGASGRVIASKQPQLTPHVEPGAFAASSPPRYREFLDALGITSAIMLPLICRGVVIGVANLMRSGGVPYDEEDLLFVQIIADRASYAIGNARSHAAERAARRTAESRFSQLFESAVIGILVIQLDGRVLEINDALLRLVGFSRDELVSGRVAWADLSPPDWAEVDLRARQQLASTGIAGLREKEYFRKDGSRVAVLVGSKLLDGTTNECISFVLDITERKEAMAAIAQLRQERAADAKFRGLLESAPDAMVIVGSDDKIALVNSQVEAVFGYTPAELVGQPIEMLIPERLRATHPAHVAGYHRNPSTRLKRPGLELFGRRKDGTEFPIEVSLSPLQTADGLLVSSAIRDVTERRYAEQERAALAAIVDASDDAIIGKALDGVITSWNPGAERLFGYTAGEIVGRSIALLLPPGHEDEEAVILARLGHGEVLRFDAVRRRKDSVEVEVSVTTSPVRDAAGRIIGASKVARDITERRRVEQALAQAKEAAEAASHELEAFSYSVAHDLRAPLRGMNGFARVLLESYGDRFDADGRDWLEGILANAKRMGELIDGLLSLSRVTRSELNRVSVDLSAMFRAIGTQLATADPARAVELVVEEELRADLDPRLARALLENLTANAWKFTSKVAAGRIELGVTTDADGRAFYVRDNGAGFDMAYAGKLFAPFQRLHSAAEFPGTGIGLATVQRIVRRHGGRIWAEAVVDGGATFFFSVPQASGEA